MDTEVLGMESHMLGKHSNTPKPQDTIDRNLSDEESQKEVSGHRGKNESKERNACTWIMRK